MKALLGVGFRLEFYSGFSVFLTHLDPRTNETSVIILLAKSYFKVIFLFARPLLSVIIQSSLPAGLVCENVVAQTSNSILIIDKCHLMHCKCVLI